jgi:hypothetical protein
VTRIRVVLAAVLAVGSLMGMSASAASAAFPKKMAGLGDSITQAFETCPGKPFTNCPENSWSTGTNKAVNSIFLRIKAASKKTTSAKNFSVSGAKAVSLNEQAKKAVKAKVEFVTVLIGANDACSVPSTSSASFTTSFEMAMNTLKSGLPNAKIFVGSVPSLMHLWELFHNNPTAVKTWEALKFCPGIMTEPTSEGTAAKARRQATLTAEEGYNATMGSICAKNPKCQFDEDEIFKTNFLESEVSTVDYFHPSIIGQASLAAGVFPKLTF